MFEMRSTKLRQLLLEIDEEAFLRFGAQRPLMPVVIAGGSAFILREVTNRPVTHDVDVLQADGRLAELLASYPMVNGDISAFSDSIPYNYEDRLVSLGYPTKAIEYLVPSLEDLAVMKLYAWRPNDVSDLTNEAFLARVDWGLLEYLVLDPDEAHASCLSERRYQEMLATYKQFVGRYRGE